MMTSVMMTSVRSSVFVFWRYERNLHTILFKQLTSGGNTSIAPRLGFFVSE